jgi:hypothetical protein
MAGKRILAVCEKSAEALVFVALLAIKNIAN